MPSKSASSQPRYVTKTELVYDTLRDRIVTLQLRPGEDITIDELARTLAVSPIPIREALARLAGERFIVNRPHIGPQVAAIDERAVHDVFALLNGLEVAAAKRVVASITDEAIEHLTAAVDVMDRPTVRSNAEKWASANADFHMRLVALADLPLVEDTLHLAFLHWERIRLHLFERTSSERQTLAQAEHRRILDRLRNGSAEDLSKLLMHHNVSACEAYIGALKTSAK